MDVRQLVKALRKQWKLVVAGFVVGTVLAIQQVQSAVPMYSATATLYVSARTVTADPNSPLQGTQLSQALVQSYANLVSSKPVAAAVVAELGGQVDPGVLRSRIGAQVLPATTLIRVSAVDPDPQQAARLANLFGQAFIAQVREVEGSGPATDGPVKVTLVEQADVPGAPFSPRRNLTIGLGIGVGLLLGAAAALLRDHLDTSIKSLADVRDAAGTAVLGTVGHDPDAEKRPLIVRDDPRSARAEAFRQLRTNIQFLNVDERLTSFVVTSAVPNEGKSTTSCNLAITMAQSGARVILVEGDLRNPSVRDYMGIEGAVGLTNVLIGEVDVEDVLQPWGGTTLSILPGGPTPPNPSELLGSHVMEQTIRHLESLADVIIFDAPPLLPVTDGALMARMTGGAILVIRSGSTRKEQVERARDLLEQASGKLLGSVLNCVPAKGPEGYGTYGAYGYGIEPTIGASQGSTPAARAHLQPRPSPPSLTGPEEPASSARPLLDPPTAVNRDPQSPTATTASNPRLDSTR